MPHTHPGSPIRPNRSEAGSILILTVLSMVAMLGIVALAVDGSYMYTERNRMAAAADAAAKSAAWEMWRGTGGNLQAFANREVVAHGFNPGGGTQVLVETPPPDGLYAGQAAYVKVTVAQDTSTFFGRILGWLNLRPGAYAVAGTSSGPNCIITLGPSPSALTVGNSTLNLNNCAVAAGGDLVSDNPNSEINASGISVTNTCLETHGGDCSAIGSYNTNQPPPLDPFANTIAPIPTLSGCGAGPASGFMATGCYSSWDINGYVTMAPGVIYVTGPITMHTGSTIDGTAGTTLVIANGGSLNLPNSSNNLNIRIVAPTGGLFPGIAIYQPATNTSPFSVNNSTTFDVTGAVYMPSADVSIRNGLAATSNCVLFVSKSLLIENGNGNFSNNCSAYSGSPLLTVTLAE